MPTIEQIHQDAESRMQKAIAATQNELASIRTGRANAQLLDRISVDYYGTPTPLRQMSNISTPDGQSLVIQPYDKSAMADIERAIAKSDLGLNPNNDGTAIRLSIPALTEDRRKEMVKQVKKYGEEGKVAIRNIRRDATEAVKKLEKEENLPEDEIKRQLDEVQKLTDRYTGQMEKVVGEKEQELLSF
jgi:ribosome recycling factor